MSDDADVIIDLTKELEALDQIQGFDEAAAIIPGEVPAGRYTVKVTDALLTRTKMANKLQITWELTIVQGGFANRKLYKRRGCDPTDDAKTIGYMKGDIAFWRVGELKQARDLVALLPLTKGKIADITLKYDTKDDGRTFSMVYLNRLIEGDAAVRYAGAEGGTGTGDPFGETPF